MVSNNKDESMSRDEPEARNKSGEPAVPVNVHDSSVPGKFMVKPKLRLLSLEGFGTDSKPPFTIIRCFPQ